MICLSCLLYSYTKFNVNMVTFWMTLLMNKFTNIVMNDGWVHPLAKTYLLLSATCDENIVMDDD